MDKVTLPETIAFFKSQNTISKQMKEFIIKTLILTTHANCPVIISPSQEGTHIRNRKKKKITKQIMSKMSICHKFFYLYFTLFFNANRNLKKQFSLFAQPQGWFSGKNKPDLSISCFHFFHSGYRNIGTTLSAVLRPEGEPAHLLGFMFGLLPGEKTSFSQSQHRTVLLS